MEVVQYIGGYHQYSGGIASVLWGIVSVLWGIVSVLWGDSFSTEGDNFSAVKAVQYTWGDNISTCRRITPAQWENNTSTVGDTFSTVGVSFSTVEFIQYSGDKDSKCYEFSKNLEIFSRAYFASQSDRPHRRRQVLTIADMVKELGYKIVVLGKILL